MIAKHNKQSEKCFNDLYCSSLYNYKSDNKSPQYLEYYRDQEIVVKMPPQFVINVDTYPQADGISELYEDDIFSISRATEQINLSGCQDGEKEGLYGRGLFHYRKWWEQSEVDIIVNGNILTGIPIFTDKNTLRVINNSYSYFIPLEKVDYIRTSDGLKVSVKED